MMSYSSPTASPDASRAAILGAASNGWSPQRQHKRDFFSPTTGSSSDMADASMMSPTASPSRTFDPKALRSHGLVSNSIFKQPGSSSSGGGGGSHPASPSRSAGLGRGAASPAAARMGVGLGIGVEQQQQQQQRQRGAFMPSRSSREELSSVAPSPSAAEVSAHGSALPPRKSKAYDMLTKSNYVTNSPFKSGGPHSPDATSPPTHTRPLSFAAEPPTTPTRSPHTEYFSTPRGPARSPANVTPSSRSALTSNRLHGPRQMSSGSPTKGASDEAAVAKQERRKTVTFDEEPDVQEFDKESSFDGQSLRSGDSNASLGSQDQQQTAADRAYYSSQRQQLTIVNGSPSDSASSPEMREHDALSLSSADSRDLDSSEASLPSSPERPAAGLAAEGDVSYDKTWATAADETAKDNSYMSLGGLHRVDSMVDELLQADILSTPPIQEHEQEEKPVRRGAAPRPPQQPQQQREDEAAVESQLFLSEPKTGDRSLPTLPNWSPIMFDSKALPDFGGLADVSQQAEISGQSTSDSPAPSPPAEVPQPRRAGGRPHISRNAVLERVAKEKKAQAEAEASEQKQAEAPRGSLGLAGTSPADTSMPVSRTGTDIASRARPSAPAAASATRGPSSQPELTATRVRQERSSYEAKPQPTPSPVEEHTVGNVSPLDRIGGALAANDAAPAASADDSAAGSPWFNPVSSLAAEAEKPSTGIKREGAPSHLALPSSSSDPQDVAAPPSPALSTRSNLGPLPPAITPEQHAEQIIARRRSKNKGGRRKRSMSTGDAGVSQARAARAAAAAGTAANEAEDAGSSPAAADSSEEIESLASDRASIQADLTASKLMLDHTVQRAVDEGFSNGLCRDISRIFRDGDSPYKVQDRGAFTSAASAEEKVSHSRQAGDVDAGKAWRKLRRPSDINEYAEEMRAYRANENPKKAAGKVFVMVDSFSPANMPVPSVPTKFFCILDNGLHVVKTGLSELNARSSVIGQEFELIQHKNLEFSLTLFVQQQQQEMEGGRAASPTKKESKTGSLTKSFMSRLLRSPKKDKSAYGHGGHDEQQSPQATMAAYTNREGAFGRVDLVFESVASSCLGKLLIIDLPVRGVADPLSSISGHASINSRRHADFPRNLSRPRGTLRLKLFYLPPMPSVPKRLLPENLRECLQGMESAAWASTARIEGILTQQGGDCRTWRRRPVKAQGSFLICYNDVTKRPTVKIDLSKAKSIDESWDPYDPSLLKGKDGKMASRKSMVKKWGADEEPDESYHVPNSFRITFGDGEVLSFFADTDEERKAWVKELKEMVESKRGAPPMWATVAREIVMGVEKGMTRPGSAGSSNAGSGASAAASMSRQGSNMTATTTASSSTAPMAASGSSGKLFAGNKVPPTVQEEAATPQRSATATPPAAAPAASGSAGAAGAARPSSPVKRKPLPTFGSSGTGAGVSNSPMPSPWDSPQQQRRPPLTPVTRTVGGSASSGGILRTPGAGKGQASTPMQQQRSAMALGGHGAGMGRPNLPTRPQSELFTPVRKGSVAFGGGAAGGVMPRRA